MCDYVEGFLREVNLDWEATVSILHGATLKAAGYIDAQNTSLISFEEVWDRVQDITVEDKRSSWEENS